MSLLTKAMPYKIECNGISTLCSGPRNVLKEARPLVKKGFDVVVMVASSDGKDWYPDAPLQREVDSLPKGELPTRGFGSLIAKNYLKELSAISLALSPIAGKRRLKEEEIEEIRQAIKNAGVSLGILELNNQEEEETDEEDERPAVWLANN